MRLTMLIASAIVFALPSLVFAKMYSVTGNKPQPAANYTRWPGLVDVVNQPARRQLVWCNGAEWFSYRGGITALNSTLQLFAEVKSPTHKVILRPGSRQQQYDWELFIVEGIVRAGIEQQELQAVRDLDPTLVIYVRNESQLDSLVLPEGVQLMGIRELRSRYLSARTQGNDRVKKEATSQLKALDGDPALELLGKEQYDAIVSRIGEFVKRKATQQ